MVNKANWPKLKESLNTIDWPTSFSGISVKLYLQVAIDSISEKCTMYVPPKRSKRNMISRFHRERKIIMRKRLKLVKSCQSAPSIKAQLVKGIPYYVFYIFYFTCNYLSYIFIILLYYKLNVSHINK